ncbi:hypothetical protein AMTRI_Chr10g6520 [Amborella trichopoda]
MSQELQASIAMKLHFLETLIGKYFSKAPKRAALLVSATLLLFTIIPLAFPIKIYSFFLINSSLWGNNITDSTANDLGVFKEAIRSCDIFRGEWVPDPRAPYYTNTTCSAIHEHQNCMKYGRPDTGFMKWKWKPDECELTEFNPSEFFETVRGKSIAFVGDSVARNHMQSLICLLSRVEYPVDASIESDDRFKRWFYTTFNFTIAAFWSPFLVKSMEAVPLAAPMTRLFNLHLDTFDDNWIAQIEGFDYVIISAGHWFFRHIIFYEKGKVVGCSNCQHKNITDLGMYYGYRRAFRTAFKAINALQNFKGRTFLRTFSPAHFEGGLWNQGANCIRTKPLKSTETKLEGTNMELYKTQIEELGDAERVGRERGHKFRVIDTSHAMLMRPDGHPGRLGHWGEENVTLYTDCVHWCLPGPIDSWNSFLLEMLKEEVGRSVLR